MRLSPLSLNQLLSKNMCQHLPNLLRPRPQLPEQHITYHTHDLFSRPWRVCFKNMAFKTLRRSKVLVYVEC